MSDVIDLFDNPKVILRPDFDPFGVSVLGFKIGDSEKILRGWNAEINDRFYHLDGGVGCEVREGVIEKIKLPLSFLERLEIPSPGELIQVLGKNDDVREISYRDRLRHTGYLWNRGLVFWWEILPVMKPGHIMIFDPRHGYPHIGKEASFTLLEGTAILERKPPPEIPPLPARENLKVGDFVKLIFCIQIEAKTFTERMWVKVTEVKPELYAGVLANDAYCTHEIKCGTPVQFHSGHVVQIHPDNPWYGFNM